MQQRRLERFHFEIGIRDAGLIDCSGLVLNKPGIRTLHKGYRAMSISSTIAKNAFFNWITAGADVAINFFVSIALARGLGAEDYGIYSFLMWFLSFLVLIVNLGLGEMAKRFIAEAVGAGSKDKVSKIVKLSLFLRGLATAAIVILLAVSAGFWAKIFGVPSYESYFFLLALGLLPNVLNTVLTSIFAGFQKYEYAAYLALGTNPLRAIAVIVFLTLGYGVREVLIINVIVWAVGVLLGFVLLHRLISIKEILTTALPDRANQRIAIKYAFTVALVMSLDFFIWDQAEVFFLGIYRPKEEVGFYSLASKLPSQVMTLIPLAFGAVILPAVSEQFGKGDMRTVRTIYLTSSRYLTMLAFPLAAAGVALAKPLVAFLYGEAYAAAAPIMAILFVSFAMMALDKSPMAIIYGINKPSIALKVGLFLAALNIGLSYWLIPRYGLLGAAIGSSVPRVLSLILYISFVSKNIKAAWPLKDTLKIAVASAGMGMLVFVLCNILSPTLGLILAVPVGLSIYTLELLVFGVVKAGDLRALKGIQHSLPRPLQRYCSPVVAMAERLLGGVLSRER